MKRKVCIVIISRANYGRIKSVLKAIDNHPDLELQLIVGASALLWRFGKVIDIIKQDGFKINTTVYLTIEGENPTTMAKSTGLALIELATSLENLKPDIVLTVADKYETLATAIASTYMNIPLAHTQGGEISGSIDESVRHAITKLAHLHFPATKLSAERIIKMGERPDTVFTVGCPSIDLINEISTDLTTDIFEKYGGVGKGLDLSKPYLLVLQHSVTTEYGNGYNHINETLKAIYDLGIQAIVMWPNVDSGSNEIAKGIRVFRESHKNLDFMHFFINFSIEDYIRILNNCVCIVGNSSSGIRESAFLGVPAVNIGSRQAGRELGRNVIDVGYDSKEIKDAILKQLEYGQYKRDYLYGDGSAGEKIAKILAELNEIEIQKKLAY